MKEEGIFRKNWLVFTASFFQFGFIVAKFKELIVRNL